MAELKLDPKKTALVLIDLQNAIVGMNPVPHTAAQVVENSKKLADAFRVHGAPVVYVRVDLNDFMKLPVDQPHNLGDKPLPAAASEITPSAGFQHGDILVTKRHWGAFAGTDLEQQLKSRGIDTVVLTGISTNAGVEFCPMIAKRPGHENSIFLALPCSLRDSCSSCTDRIIWASAPVLRLF